MTFDKEMTRSIYRYYLGKSWSIDRLYNGVDNYIMNRGTSIDEWTDNFCLNLARYKQ